MLPCCQFSDSGRFFDLLNMTQARCGKIYPYFLPWGPRIMVSPSTWPSCQSGSCRNSTGLAPGPLEVAACHRFSISPPGTLFIYRDKELGIALESRGVTPPYCYIQHAKCWVDNKGRLVVILLSAGLGICPNEPFYTAEPHVLYIALNAPRLTLGVSFLAWSRSTCPPRSYSSQLRCFGPPYCLTQGASLSSSSHFSFISGRELGGYPCLSDGPNFH